LGDTSPARRNQVPPQVNDDPRMPERPIVSIPRASVRLQWTFCTTPSCPQFGGHRTIRRYESTPPQPGASACWRRPAKARESDGDHPQGIRARATNLLDHAMVSLIAWPSTYWDIQVHPAANGASANWRRPAKARETDRDHPQDIRASAMNLLQHATVSPIV